MSNLVSQDCLLGREREEKPASRGFEFGANLGGDCRSGVRMGKDLVDEEWLVIKSIWHRYESFELTKGCPLCLKVDISSSMYSREEGLDVTGQFL